MTEYWQDIIPAVKTRHPDVLFIAEAYWDREYELMQKGFDYCYDKRLYDRLVHDDAESVRAHLTAGLVYQDRLVRFIENHDEPRAAAVFCGPKERAAAVVVATAPGAKLIYEGQIEGRKVKLPVFLARRPAEPRDEALAAFYRSLLSTIHADLFHTGDWRLCERHGWPDNASFHNVVAWTWRLGVERTLVVLNLADHRSQAMVQLPWDDLRGRTWRLVETLNWECYVRDGDELTTTGLFVDLDAWRYHFLKLDRARAAAQVRNHRTTSAPMAAEGNGEDDAGSDGFDRRRRPLERGPNVGRQPCKIEERGAAASAGLAVT